jgi:hypothetical protein
MVAAVVLLPLILVVTGRKLQGWVEDAQRYKELLLNSPPQVEEAEVLREEHLEVPAVLTQVELESLARIVQAAQPLVIKVELDLVVMLLIWVLVIDTLEAVAAVVMWVVAEVEQCLALHPWVMDLEELADLTMHPLGLQ